MIGMTSVFDADKHSRIGGEIGAFIDRLSSQTHRHFGVIRYNELGVFCIIEYLSPNRDVFVDTMNLGDSLANFTRAKANELQQRVFAPLTCRETSEALEKADSDFHHLRQSWNDEEQERLEKCAIGE